MLTRIFPFVEWLRKYTVAELRVDFVAGLTVALVLIPQSMAYAQLAGLPAYYGLYAAFLPPLIAALFGSSRQLATGPVAVVSLMTATALEPLATAGSGSFIAYAIVLALMVGVFQFLLGVFRLGLVVNFLSHPVVNGFTNAAAIIIATSQLSKLFGVSVESADHHYETVYRVIVEAIRSTHWETLGLAVLAFVIMIASKRINPKIPGVLIAVGLTTIIAWGTGYEHNRQVSLEQIQSSQFANLVEDFNNTLDNIDRKSEERVQLSAEIQEKEQTLGEQTIPVVELKNQRVLLSLEIEEQKEEAAAYRTQLRSYRFTGVKTDQGTLALYPRDRVPPNIETDGRTWRIKVGNSKLTEAGMLMMGGGAVVGRIPEGLPSFIVPKVNAGIIFNLLSMAIIISFIGFMEAISIAKAMAAKTGQRLDPNQELIGQGLGNILGSFNQSYAVSGSFSRSAVNIQSGAKTGLSSVFSSVVVAITLLLLTPLLYHLPQAVLAAIIMMAVVGLINVRGFIHAWNAQKYDGIIGIVTFVGTLGFAPHLDRGIIIGVILSLGLYLIRNIRPNIALLSLYTDGTYRSAERMGLQQCRYISVIRFNGSLIFANVAYLEDQVLEQVRSMPDLKYVLIVGNGINEMDASGEEKLSELVDRLREDGYDLFLSGLNDSVLDVMRRTYLYQKIGEDHLFRNATRAIDAIYESAHRNSMEKICPLQKVAFKGLPVSAKVKRRGIFEGGRERLQKKFERPATDETAETYKKDE
jgi:MFS superfamily sulfate permease-like transporter